MNLKINSRHLEVTPGIRMHLENGVQKILKHFDQVIDASVFLMIDNAKEKNNAGFWYSARGHKDGTVGDRNG